MVLDGNIATPLFKYPLIVAGTNNESLNFHLKTVLDTSELNVGEVYDEPPQIT